MTMSISSAPAATAARVSASLMSRNVWPDGNAVATDATLTLEPLSASLASATKRRVDADRRDVRDRRVARLRVHRLRAQRPDLARRVLPLERREIHHPDREVERPQLRRLLDRPLLERVDPLLDADLVDRLTRPSRLAERSRPAPSHARTSSWARSRGRVSRATGVGHGRRVYTGACRAAEPGSAPGADLRQRRQRALASTRKCGNQSRTWTRFSARRNGARSGSARASPRGRACSRTGRLFDRRTREQRLGLADRRPDVVLAVLDQQRRPDVASA